MQGESLFSAALLAVVVLVSLLTDSAHSELPLNGEMGFSLAKREEGISLWLNPIHVLFS